MPLMLPVSLSSHGHLITKMDERGMGRKVDARTIAEQNNYVSISLTQEYFMAKNGLADMHYD